MPGYQTRTDWGEVQATFGDRFAMDPVEMQGDRKSGPDHWRWYYTAQVTVSEGQRLGKKPLTRASNLLTKTPWVHLVAKVGGSVVYSRNIARRGTGHCLQLVPEVVRARFLAGFKMIGSV
jgi:hypothetical protein